MGRTLLFDWGNTIMIDYGYPGPMYLWEKAGWMPYAENALNILSRDYPCYLATNAGLSDQLLVMKALKRVGADSLFSGVFTSTDIGFEKPHPEFFRAICDKLKVSPAECIMTGDHYLKDISGAKQFGMKTVWLNLKMQKGDFPMADRIILSMAELPEIIKKL